MGYTRQRPQKDKTGRIHVIKYGGKRQEKMESGISQTSWHYAVPRVWAEIFLEPWSLGTHFENGVGPCASCSAALAHV